MAKKKSNKDQKRPSKRKSPTLLDKLVILSEIDVGTSKRAIARNYNIPRPTVYEIEKNRAKLIEAFEQDVPMEQKHLMKAHHPELEDRIYEWIERKRMQQRAILSCAVIQVSTLSVL